MSERVAKKKGVTKKARVKLGLVNLEELSAKLEIDQKWLKQQQRKGNIPSLWDIRGGPLFDVKAVVQELKKWAQLGENQREVKKEKEDESLHVHKRINDINERITVFDKAINQHAVAINDHAKRINSLQSLNSLGDYDAIREKVDRAIRDKTDGEMYIMGRLEDLCGRIAVLEKNVEELELAKGLQS